MRLFLKRTGSDSNRVRKAVAFFFAFVMLVTLNAMATVTSSAATTSFSVERKSYNSIEINWSALEGATSYQILRATGGTSDVTPSRPSDNEFEPIATGITGLSYIGTR